MPEAAHLLGLDETSLVELSIDLDSVFVLLSKGATEDALALLRASVGEYGSRRRPRKLGLDSEQTCLRRLQTLGRRVRDGELIPGMTVHQAKGREWARVGLILAESQLSRLSAGLQVKTAKTDSYM